MTATDIDRLRLTVRRCTALLVGVVGLHMGAVARYDNNWPTVLVAGAVLYLASSFVLAPRTERDSAGTTTDDSGTDGDGTASTGDGVSGDGTPTE